MYIPPLGEYMEFALGFVLAVLLMDLARYAYRWIKLYWLRYCLKRNLKALQVALERFREEVERSNKT